LRWKRGAVGLDQPGAKGLGHEVIVANPHSRTHLLLLMLTAHLNSRDGRFSIVSSRGESVRVERNGYRPNGTFSDAP
jgi:hypothetical protein